MTRAGMIWVAVTAGLVVLVLLIIFILQNQDRVNVHYFGFAGELSLGMALFIAAVAGGILVAIAGAARILQLRKQRRRPDSGQSATPPSATPPSATPPSATPPSTSKGSTPPANAPTGSAPTGQPEPPPGTGEPRQ